MRLSSENNKEKVEQDRDLLSLLFFYLSVLLMVFSLYSIGEAWYHAFKDGWLPEDWANWEGNHGPWRHYYPGGELVWRSLCLQILSFWAALISLFFKRSWRSFVLLLISIVFFFLAMGTHYWLVD